MRGVGGRRGQSVIYQPEAEVESFEKREREKGARERVSVGREERKREGANRVGYTSIVQDHSLLLYVWGRGV